MYILGAGLAGCIAASINSDASILEASSKPLRTHKALLRFKTDIVSQVTGIPFKKVTALKAIWYDGKEVCPSPRFTAMYSSKVANNYSHRSIINIDAEERYIAPKNFHEMLLEQFDNRIKYNSSVEFMDNVLIDIKGTTNSLYRKCQPIISTIPISIAADVTGFGTIDTSTNFKSIYVNTFDVKNCDMYTTVYFPDIDTDIYRASITGNKLIVESLNLITIHEFDMVFNALGLFPDDCLIDAVNYRQEFGKISKVDEHQRRKIIAGLTMKYNIYSLGRFATWKNIQLDEVVHDCFKIKELMNKDHYNLLKEMEL